MEQEINDETQDRIRAYFTDPQQRRFVENQLAAHLMVHTNCKLDVRTALVRAGGMYEHLVSVPEQIVASPPSGRYARAKDSVTVELPTAECGHKARFIVGLGESSAGELPVRLTHGTKQERAEAWAAVQDGRNAEVREEARRLHRRPATIKA